MLWGFWLWYGNWVVSRGLLCGTENEGIRGMHIDFHGAGVSTSGLTNLAYQCLTCISCKFMHITMYWSHVYGILIFHIDWAAKRRSGFITRKSTRRGILRTQRFLGRSISTFKDGVIVNVILFVSLDGYKMKFLDSDSLANTRNDQSQEQESRYRFISRRYRPWIVYSTSMIAQIV